MSTLIAAGVGVIVMTALSQQLLSQTRMTRYLEAKMEAINLKQELVLMLGSDLNCDASFAGLTVNVANTTGGDYTDITSLITGANPLNVIRNSYTTNNRLINISEVRLFKPLNKLSGLPNNASPYEFQVRITAQEKGGLGQGIIVNGPTLVLNVTGTTVDANGCVAPGAAAPTCVTTGYINVFDGGVGINCGEGYLAGTMSYHNNFNEDRRFAFKCCFPPGANSATMTTCSAGDSASCTPVGW